MRVDPEFSEWKPRNRVKTKEPRGRSMWCYGCDRNCTYPGEKCDVCGYVLNSKRAKGGKPSHSFV